MKITQIMFMLKSKYFEDFNPSCPSGSKSRKT